MKITDQGLAILETLRPLAAKANVEKKWIRSFYQDLRFSPKEALKQWESGSLLWGPTNFELIDPPVMDLDSELRKLKVAKHELDQRINYGWLS